ncbi:hypothetical protein NBRC116494_16520 [Aurantivibrio plasticivorans]
MNAEISEILSLLRREIWDKRRVFAALYLITSLAFLGVGWFWPKSYTSSSAILVDQFNILRPLMEGTAVTTDVVDRARIARQIISSRGAMEEALVTSGWVTENSTELEKEKAIVAVGKMVEVRNAGRNLLSIAVKNADPEVAYKTASAITDVFIEHSISAKQKESQDAYDFINGQVEEYQEKLQVAEQALKDFHTANVDARPGSQDEVNGRIMELRRRMEATQLEVRELKIRKETLQKQLSGEAAITENLTREGQYRERLAALEEQLSTLRLSYLDTYPDIVRIKTQIATIETALLKEQESNAGLSVADKERGISQAATTSLLYQELRSQASAAETQLASLTARLEETKQLLAVEEERIIRINDVEAKLAQLTRDYQVNQELYQSLLRQRENARISMNIDKENQGMTFKVQEHAALPLTPEGIRFAHFLAAGAILSFMLPLCLIYGVTLIDQKVRSEKLITEGMGLPVLASVYHVNTPTEYTLNTFKKSIILFVILLSWALYGYAAWLRIAG